MSDPSQHNPYGQPPPYGYPPPPQPGPTGPGGPGYPQYPGGPGGMMPMRMSMPGLVVTARVLLFVAGGLWALTMVFGLIMMLAASDIEDDADFGVADSDVVVVGVVILLVGAALAALHIVSASMFGKGRTGVRVMGIITASLNLILAGFSLLGSLAQTGAPGGILLSLLWVVTALLTVIFLSLRPAGEWFNRPQH
ncbi:MULTISPECIES: hypothetical protein [unclassified Streptomyces]|uniref:hypothetical protein n=1 Tax=unclassified Streptomyces TaxID=2593676 RepID=UPI0022B6D598|nr:MULTISPECIES: hypothetical protein [unclassified Streptomyces]MCZ7417042.1 hypothetical protein [Streptomyces sp. WMMC897]MCZ7433130.1 hypothetical protein [Streptomyces sp. WMMC1477]